MALFDRFFSNRSIKTRLLVLLSFMTVIALSAYAAITYSATMRVRNLTQEIGEKELRAQGERYLSQVNKRILIESEAFLDKAKRDTLAVAASAASFFDQGTSLVDKNLWPVDEHMFFGPERQYANSETDITSVFVPNSKEIDERVIHDIEISSYLDFVLPAIFDNNMNAEALYFATPNDVVRYYPNVNLGKVLPPDFSASQRIWFSGSVIENNPQKELWWTPVYSDATGLGLVTTAAAPVYGREGNFIGVVGLDFSLNQIKSKIEETHFLESGFSFLIDGSGQTIALPKRGYQIILGDLPEENQGILIDLLAEQNAFTPIIQKMVEGQSGLETLEVSNRAYYVAYQPMKSTGWSLASVIDADYILQGVRQIDSDLTATIRSLTFTQVVPVTVLIFTLLVFIGLAWTNRIFEPIKSLAEAAQKLGAGKWDVDIPVSTGGEIGLLAQSFRTMKAQLNGLFVSLEQRVAERTRDLEKRSLQLQTASEVARDITGSHDMQNLLNNAVQLIRERFGFYHAGIFLIDEQHEYAQLVAATGEAGRKMLEQRHRLKVGAEGLVGYVTGKGSPRIALDVGADAVHFKNPLLPMTRSEMALPLKLNERIIGALNVQSMEEAAFDKEDITVLQILADQLAIAIENIRLVDQLETALKETALMYQQQVRDSWTTSFRQKQTAAFEYDRVEVRQAQNPIPATVLKKLQSGQHAILNGNHPEISKQQSILLVPIMLREHYLGVIGVEEDDPNHQWTADEIAIIKSAANQAAITLENTRLLEATMQQAEREKMVGEITAQLRETLDIESVLQTAAREIRAALKVASVDIHMGTDHLLQNEVGSSKTD